MAQEALHAEFKAGFSAFCLLSHPPPFEAVLMSKDVKSLPGEGRRGGPAAGLAKLSTLGVCVTLVSVLFNTVRVLN